VLGCQGDAVVVVVVVVEEGRVVVVEGGRVVVVEGGRVVVVKGGSVVVVEGGSVVVVAVATEAGGAVAGLPPTGGAGRAADGIAGGAAGAIARATGAFGTALAVKGDFKAGQGFVLPLHIRAVLVVAAAGAEGLDERKLIARSAVRAAMPAATANGQRRLRRGQRVMRWDRCWLGIVAVVTSISYFGLSETETPRLASAPSSCWSISEESSLDLRRRRATRSAVVDETDDPRA
jgi:hypothetical protein